MMHWFDSADSSQSIFENPLLIAGVTVTLGALLTIRGFFVQKHIDRMATKYDELFQLLLKLEDQLRHDAIKLREDVTHSPDGLAQMVSEMRKSTRVARFYASSRADKVFRKYEEEIGDNLARSGDNTDAEEQKLMNAMLKTHEACIDSLQLAARRDLSPNIGQFLWSFVTG
jgi:hypothetical protein